MTLILTALCLLGYPLVLTRFNRQPIEANCFIGVSLIITILYAFAYVGHLDAGRWFILLSGAAAWGISGFYDRKDLFNCFTPGLCAMLFFSILFSLVSYHLQVTDWDELSHWAPHAKLMFFHHGLIQASDVTINKSYPPASQLFYYLFYGAQGYSEGVTYIAQQLLLLAALVVFAQKVEWKNWPVAFITYALAILLCKALGTRFAYQGSLYMDNMVGIYLGAALSFYRLSTQKNTTTLLWLIPVLTVTLLMKIDLIPLIFIVLMIIGLDQLYRLGWKNFLRTTPFAALILLMLITCLINFSWVHYLHTIQVTFDKAFTMVDLFKNPFSNPLTKPMLSTLYHKDLLEPLTMLSGISVTLICTLLLDQKSLKPLLIEYSGLLLGFIIYVLGLLFIYLHAFVAFECVNLASFGRYTNIYYLMWWLVTLASLLAAIKNHPWMQEKKYQFSLLFILAMTMGLITHAYYQRIYQPGYYEGSIPFMLKNITLITDAAEKKIPVDKRVLMIWQNSSGYQRFAMLYHLTPRPFVNVSGSFGRAYAPNDIWTRFYTSAEFKALLAQSDYVLIGYADTAFWQRYGKFFPKNPSPLVTYQVCMGKEKFNPWMTENCQVVTQHAYLFKTSSLLEGA